MDIQHLVDGMNAAAQRERAKSQLTLGRFIDALEAMPPDNTMDGISRPHSYRGYYCDLAFESWGPITVRGALIVARSAMGEIFTGYKGVEFMMGRLTPIWIASYGSSGGKRITGISTQGRLKLEEDEI